MKNLKILLFSLVVLFINASCAESKNSQNPIPDVFPDPILDSIAYAMSEKDSLNPKKYIYLTIDDAPLHGSEYIDSIISQEKIKTNLFLVGNIIDESTRFLKYHKMFQENRYIEIYNHSYSHANNNYLNFYKNPKLVLNDFKKNQSDFNISHKIARLPGRNLWQIGNKKKNYQQTGSTSAKLLAENGYKIFGWDVEWNYNTKNYSPIQSIDALVKEIDSSYDTSRTFTENHVVLLMHNQMFRKVNEKNDLKELINKLKKSNFTFEYLSAYPS